MKLAKKVLSVVLAVMMALSAFAVVGSANGDPETATHNVKVWLTGSVGSATWTTNSKVSIEEGDESEAGATIEVQPGDTVFVRLYVTNDYYVHTIQVNLFYSADLIDAAEEYQTQRGKAITSAYLKKIHVWNSDNYWAGLQGTAYSAQNAWSLQADAFNTDVEQNWPTDDEGNNLYNIEEWKFNRLNNLVTEGVGETCIFEEEVHLIMMPVKVPETAQAGDKFYVTVPEGTEQRENKVKGALRLYENGIADGESEVCEIVDTQASLNPNLKYSDEALYWDLSEAKLTLVVPGEAEETIDYTSLEDKIEEAESVDTSNATASSKSALETAITVAQAMLDGQTASSQDDVAAMVQTLADAIAAVTGLADFTALNEQIARYDAITDSSVYTTDSWADATTAYNSAKAIDQTEVSDQDAVDTATSALKTALDNLAPNLDYSALEELVAELDGKDVSIYTDETGLAFYEALTVAQAMLDNKTATSQDEITEAYNALVAADKALTEKDADYTYLDEMIDRYEQENIDSDGYTSASWEEATTAYNVAIAVSRDLKISSQATVDEAATALKTALDNLVPATGATYTALDEAIAEYESKTAAHYTTDSWAEATTAYNVAKAVSRELTSEDQATIDDATTALKTALDYLVEADADYTAVNEAIAAAEAKIVLADEGTLRYTDETIAGVEAAIDAVLTGLMAKDQATVDGYVTAINEAVAALAYRDYDNSAVLALIEEFKSYNRDDYDYTSYDAVATFIETYVTDYTHEYYAKAKLQDINFMKKWNALEKAAAADYSEVEAAIDAFEAKIAAADYEQDGIDAVNAIIDGIDYSLNVNAQDTVDGYATDIREATDALVEVVVVYVDYARLDAAITAAKAVDESLYTADSYSDLTTALYTAESISRNLTVDNQSYVDEVAEGLEKVIDALEKVADYTDLDAAILRAGTYDENAWTTDSWAVVEEKLAAAEAVDRDLGETSQATIDDAAKALNEALDALEAKAVVSSIMTVNWTPSEDTYNTFKVSVSGRMAMIQFIEEDGGTRTYDRYNKNVTIVSYNADGEEVNTLDRSVSYEVWTINTNLIGPDVKARAKYLSGTSYIWETETYNFTVELLEPTYDAGVRSITPAATSGKKGAVATTVVVGPDAQGVRFVMDNGTTTTYYAEKATVLDNGDLQFVGNAWANNNGLNTIIVKVRVNGAWVEAGTIEYTVE